MSPFWSGVIAGVASTVAFLACALLALGWFGARLQQQIDKEHAK